MVLSPADQEHTLAILVNQSQRLGSCQGVIPQPWGKVAVESLRDEAEAGEVSDRGVWRDEFQPVLGPGCIEV